MARFALPDLTQCAELLNQISISVASRANHFLSSSHAANLSIVRCNQSSNHSISSDSFYEIGLILYHLPRGLVNRKRDRRQSDHLARVGARPSGRSAPLDAPIANAPPLDNKIRNAIHPLKRQVSQTISFYHSGIGHQITPFL